MKESTYVYGESDGKYHAEIVKHHDDGSKSHHKKVYYEDQYGNIVKIITYTEGKLMKKYTFTYDGYRSPGNYSYLAHNALNGYKKEYGKDMCMPENKFPVWHEQPCNISEYTCEERDNDIPMAFR